ncbi:alanine aminotransferase 2-like [Porites lutea]|uniref:alanine aminotransferase 2-like n=1 Tax=Porites lutea TaxID=51062 RepID=UPI003CC59B51
MTTEVLNSMENVKCNEVAGAMYAFPRITLPKKAIEAAKYQLPVKASSRDSLKYRYFPHKESMYVVCLAKEMPPDEFWQALEKTGIYMIPGHVFDMKGSSNNFYYRITILPSEETFAPMFERLRTFHQEFMAQFKDMN